MEKINKEDSLDDLGYRSKFKQPKEESSSIQRLCKKHGVLNYEGAAAFEQGHQAILEIIKRPGALEGMFKAAKIHFANKLEFEEMWKRGEINSLWDFYMTKDEMMKCCRNNVSFGRWGYNPKERNWEMTK